MSFVLHKFGKVKFDILSVLCFFFSLFSTSGGVCMLNLDGPPVSFLKGPFFNQKKILVDHLSEKRNPNQKSYLKVYIVVYLLLNTSFPLVFYYFFFFFFLLPAIRTYDSGNFNDRLL